MAMKTNLMLLNAQHVNGDLFLPLHIGGLNLGPNTR